MSTPTESIEELATREYKYGFVTDIEADAVPPGLSEDVIRAISEKKGEPAFMLAWRLADPSRADDPTVRPYCVQYNESDLAFVSRLLEQEGIAFHIENGKVTRLVAYYPREAAFADLDPQGE